MYSAYDGEYGDLESSQSTGFDLSGTVGTILEVWSLNEQRKIDERLAKTKIEQDAALRATQQRQDAQANTGTLTIGGKQVSIAGLALLGMAGLVAIIALKK